MKARMNLKLRRIGLNLSAQQIAAKLGISRTAYCLIETGKRNPSWEVVKKIADYFQLKTVEDLKKILEG